MQTPDSMESSLSDDQERVLSLLRIACASLSIFGSSIIMFRVLRTNRTKLGPYHRIMLILSCYDFIFSIGHIMGPFLLPKQTSSRVWAIGTDVSCIFMGWLNQLCVGGVCYNGVLSFYFLATIRHGIKPDEFAATYEPYFLLIIFYFLFTATAGVPFEVYGELQLNIGCWVKNDYGCDKDGSGCVGDVIAWFYAGGPTIVTIVMLPINYIRIFRHVNRKLRIGNTRTPAQVAHVRRLAVQGLLYVLAFYVSYAPQLCVRIVDGYGQHGPANEHEIYPLFVVLSIFFPIAGLFNMLVFIRPDFIRLRHAGYSVSEATKRAMFSNRIPRLAQTNHTNTATGIHPNNLQKSESGPSSHQSSWNNRINNHNNNNQYQRLNAKIATQAGAPQDESWSVDDDVDADDVRNFIHNDSTTEDMFLDLDEGPSAQM